MSWFTTYRPRTFSELHLVDVREKLLKLLTASQFPQVLLFAGPRGTGKTSSARIIGALLNDPANQERVDELFFGGPVSAKKTLQEPKSDDQLVERIRAGRSYVVTELDAASNRGIDDVRQLRERLSLPPQEGKVAVYILDEVHMLTNEAFNALLKVFEEPPAHVVFVLATTELHKLPATIVSRCFVVPFRQAQPDELVSALEVVLKAEAIPYEKEALVQIAKLADGSFRDAVKMAEQIAQPGSKLSLALVEKQHVGSLEQDFRRLTQTLLDKDAPALLSVIENWRTKGFDEKHVVTEYLSWLHLQLLHGFGLAQTAQSPIASEKVVQFILKNLSDQTLLASPIPFLRLELVLLDLVLRAQQKATQKK